MSLLFRLHEAELGYSDNLVLSSFSWQVERGERWAIVGPNGAGKTTLLRSILGLISLRGGELSFYNTEGSKQVTRPSLGYLPQINHIDKGFPISVEEVIASGLHGSGLSPSEQRERIGSLLRQIELEAYRHQAIGKLSGGQLQRVLLSRALADAPELLILDEPTSFLDRRYKEQFLQLLTKLTGVDTTILMVTHDLPEDEAKQWKILPIGSW